MQFSPFLPPWNLLLVLRLKSVGFCLGTICTSKDLGLTITNVSPLSLQPSSAKSLSSTARTKSASKSHGCVTVMTTVVIWVMRWTVTSGRTSAVIQSSSAKHWTACASICHGNVMETLTVKISPMKSIVSFLFFSWKNVLCEVTLHLIGKTF